MTIHKLKIRPEYFNAVVWGHKRAELRKNDRDYKVGDLICLLEYSDDSGFSTRSALFRITHVCDVNEWAPGCLMLSIEFA